MELLKKLYSIHSHSGREKKMIRFIVYWIKTNVKEARIKVDTIGNIFVTKGNEYQRRITDGKVYCSSYRYRKDQFAEHDAQDYCNCRRSKSEVEEDHLDYRADELCNFIRKRQ